MSIPRKQQQELIRRMLAHRQFAHAESLRRIVLLLFERSQEGGGASLKEQEIAIQALGRPADFDPKVDPIVRVSMASIRDRMRRYFANEGNAEPVRVTVPKGQYRLQFEVLARAATESPSSSARARFWLPYLAPSNPNLAVIADLLFFRDEEGGFHRNIYLNDRAAPSAEVRERMHLPDHVELTPSFHFVSAGEMNCLLAVTRCFAEMGASLDYRNARFFSWADARRANLILLGSMRTNAFVRSLQGNLPLQMTLTAIEEMDIHGEALRTWMGLRQRDGDLERVVEYALVTRREGPVAGTTVTMISANHGRAIEGAGDFLTEESHLRGLEEIFGRETLPEQFQLVLRVEMLDYDEEVVDVSYAAHRVLPARPSKAAR